jgi:hypothetical protein
LGLSSKLAGFGSAVGAAASVSSLLESAAIALVSRARLQKSGHQEHNGASRRFNARQINHDPQTGKTRLETS